MAKVPYDVMAKYGNTPSRSQLYRKSKSPGGVTEIAKNPARQTAMSKGLELLQSGRANPGAVQRGTPGPNTQSVNSAAKSDLLLKRKK